MPAKRKKRRCVKIKIEPTGISCIMVADACARYFTLSRLCRTRALQHRHRDVAPLEHVSTSWYVLDMHVVTPDVQKQAVPSRSLSPHTCAATRKVPTLWYAWRMHWLGVSKYAGGAGLEVQAREVQAYCQRTNEATNASADGSVVRQHT